MFIPLLTALSAGSGKPVCPSRNVTGQTPQTTHRSSLSRDVTGSSGMVEALTQLQHEYEYDAVETCAVDGSCADACPIGTNTGALMKHFRKMEDSVMPEEVALDWPGSGLRWRSLRVDGINAADRSWQTITSPHLLGGLTDMARSVVSKDLVPTITGPMPHAAPADLPKNETRVVQQPAYFPVCINRIFGRDNTKPASPAPSSDVRDAL